MEYAIIARVNDQNVVTYVHDSMEEAKREALETKAMLGAESVTIAETVAFIGEDGEVEAW